MNLRLLWGSIAGMYVNGARRNREAHLNGVQICYVTSLAIYRSHLGLCFSLLLKRTETEWRLRFRTQASSGWCLVLFKGDIHVPRAKDNLISCIVRWIRPMKQSASCHMSFEWAQCARNKSHCRIDGRSTIIITWRQISSSTPYYRATKLVVPTTTTREEECLSVCGCGWQRTGLGFQSRQEDFSNPIPDVHTVLIPSIANYSHVMSVNNNVHVVGVLNLNICVYLRFTISCCLRSPNGPVLVVTICSQDSCYDPWASLILSTYSPVGAY